MVNQQRIGKKRDSTCYSLFFSSGVGGGGGNLDQNQNLQSKGAVLLSF